MVNPNLLDLDLKDSDNVSMHLLCQQKVTIYYFLVNFFLKYVVLN